MRLGAPCWWPAAWVLLLAQNPVSSPGPAAKLASRLERQRLVAVAQARAELAAARQHLPTEGLYQDFPAALGVEAGGGCARCQEALEAAKATGIRVVGLLGGKPGVGAFAMASCFSK
jgi:hypothetical protein